MKQSVLTLLQKASVYTPMDRRVSARWLGVSEREIRKRIEELRNDGYRIVSSSTNGGYWLATTDEEYTRFRAEYISRATKIFETVKAMDKVMEGQVEL